MFQNTTQIVKKKVILLMISNREKRERSKTVATQLSSNDNGTIFH